MADTDEYTFNVVSGTNNLEFNSQYNGFFINTIDASFSGQSYQIITINTTSPISDAVVNLSIQKQPEMKSDFGDIRFIYSNGTPIIYYISGYNSTHANISIRVNLTSTTNVQMWYGNSSNSSLSNLNGLYLYYYSGSNYSNMSITMDYTNADFKATFDTWGNNPKAVIRLGANSNTTPYIETDGYNKYLRSYINTGSGYFDLGPVNYTRQHQINISFNPNNTINISNTIGGNTKYFDGNNTALKPFHRFQNIYTYKNGSYYAYANVTELRLYNTTTTTINISDPISTNFTSQLTVPSSIFSSINYVSTLEGVLNISINYTPHVVLLTANDSILDYGTINLNYTPHPSDFTSAYQISKDSNFAQTIYSGNATNGNIYIENIELFGQYYWRMQNGNGLWTDARIFEVGDRLTLTGHVVDGITGEFITKYSTFTSQVISTNTTASAVSSTQARSYINNSSVIFSQGGTSKTVTFDNENASFTIEDVQLDVPFILTIQSTNVTSFLNTGYQLTIPKESPKYDLNFSVLRNITPINTSVYGIVSDKHGAPISNGQVVFYFPNGTIKETVLIQPGGEYGLSNASGEFYVSYQAPGFKTIEGYVTGPSMNHIVMEGIYNITIGAIDSATQENISAFTTYLGENQTIQSTDNGTVKYSNVSEGEIDIIIQADGYNQISRKIYIGDNKTNFTLYMTKSNNSSGGVIESPQYVRYVVVNQFGQKVSNALIQIYEDDTENNLLMYKYTGSDGSATFSVNRTLPYYIIVSKPSNGIEYNYTMSGVYSDLYYIYVIANDNTQQNKPIDRVILASAKLKINHGEVSNAYAYILVDVHSTNNEQLFADITTDTTLPNYILVDNTTTLQHAYYMNESEYNNFKSNLTKLNFEINATVNKATGNYENVVSYQFTNAGINLLQLNVDKDVMAAISTVIIYIIALSLAAYTTGFYTGIATIISAIGLNYIGWIVLPQTFWLFAALFVIVGIYNIMKDRM